MLSVASKGESPAVALSCLVCRSRYTTEPPTPGSLLELVRGTGGAALAALLHPGTFLVSRERALPDAATRERAELVEVDHRAQAPALGQVGVPPYTRGGQADSRTATC